MRLSLIRPLRRICSSLIALVVFSLSGVIARGQAPAITAVSSPRQVVTVGQNLTLSLTATGATSYQWKRNGLAIAGATAASYAIMSAVPVRDNGWYQAVVTNGDGSTTSAVVFVSVAVSPANIAAWGSNEDGQTTVPTGLTNVVAIAGGQYHSLALKADGTVVAWSLNDNGQATVPMGLTDVVAIAGGDFHSLALKADGTVVGWGDNSNGQTRVPTGLTDVVALAAGGNHSLALKTDGTVVGWGDNSNGETTAPTGLTDVAAIAGGSNHSLALKTDGTVVAWGNNFSGESTVPTGLTNVVTIAGGYYHSLALKADGTVVAWGYNSYSQTTVPAGLTNVVTIAGRYSHSLALKADGTVVGWGNNGSGQTTVPAGLIGGLGLAAGYSCSLVLRNAVGDVAPTITTHPASRGATDGQNVLLSVVATAGGTPMTYQWRKDTVNIWGATAASYTVNAFSAASLGSYDVVVSNYLGSVVSNAAALTLSVAGPVITAISSARQVVTVGQNLTLGVTATGATSYQWKRNGLALAGATDAGYTITSAVPARDNGWYQVVATNGMGSTTSAVIFVNVAVSPANMVAWGGNDAGQISVPTGVTNVVALAARDLHSLALKSDGTVVAWGDYTFDATTVPTGLTNVVAIAAGQYHSLALKADGTVVAWGDYTSDATTVPTGLTNVVAIAAGQYHSLALKADGTVAAWGYNRDGQTTVPTGLTNVVALAGGYGRSLALRSDGTVVAWGDNSNGPTTVSTGLTDVVAVAAGYNHCLALKADGTVVAWGDYTSDATTVPTGLTDVVAIAAGQYHNLALKADGTVAAWGYNRYGQATVPTWLAGGLGLSAGSNHSLVLRNAAGDLAPTITTQPASLTAFTGQNVTLSVSATGGSAVLSYQWRKDGVAITGATGVTLPLPLVATANAGGYDVVITNWLGTVTSSLATLSVSATAGVTINHTGRQVVAGGQNLTLTATAVIPGPVTYQWRRNGLAVAGATAASYAITSAVPVRDGGWYQAIATNGTVSTTSAVVFISVAVSPVNIAAWGDNSAGQTTVPTALATVVALAGGGHHTFALKADGTVVAWGNTSAGMSAGLANVVAIAGGAYHGLALIADGTVVAWDHDVFGQATVPAGLTNVVAIAGGDFHSLALKANGTVVAWGKNDYGQATVPTGLTNVVALAGGSDQSLALKADGTVVAWGDNGAAQTAVPIGLTNVAAIAGGGYHSLALKTDGTVVAWGLNYYGQTTVPTGLTNVVAIAGGQYHSLALKADGTVVAWGKNDYGQTTLPTGLAGGLRLAAGYSHSLVLCTVAAVAPAITTQPVGLSVPVGASATFTVVATGTPAPTYQWRKGTVALNGETNASFTRATAQLTDAGSYTVVVTNSAGSATSDAAILNVVPVGASASHAVTRGGYVAGGTVTIMNTLNCPAGTTLARWQVQLPAGWSYASSGGTAATTMPAVGASGLVEWSWSTPPTSPLPFSYTLNVPAGATGAIAITASPILTVSGSTVSLLSAPNPLTVNAAAGKHSADTDGNGQISLVELTRVIELYNARTGTLRTGRYLVATTPTGDGFVADPTNSTAALVRYHATDTNRDGRFSLIELTRVIELFGMRSGALRTGAYHVQEGTEDGFAPGP